MGSDQLFEARFRLVRAVKRIQVQRKLDLRVAVKRRTQRQALVDLVGKFRLLHRLVEIAQREQRQRMRGREIERQLQVNEPEILPSAPAERGAEPVKHLGGTRLPRVGRQSQ